MKHKLKYIAFTIGTTAAMAVPVLAEGGGSSSGTGSAEVISAMTSLASDMKSTGLALVPIGLTVVGVTLVVRYGIRVFKAIAKP